MLADMFSRLTVHNDLIPLTQSSLTRFHSRAAPQISISDYLKRIVKYASVERVCLLILLLYIDRICKRNTAFTISSLTVHRFIITGVAVGSKALCDSFLQNSMYAKVGGISTKELNILELEFLFLIDWELTADANDLQQCYVSLVKQSPGYAIEGLNYNGSIEDGDGEGEGDRNREGDGVNDGNDGDGLGFGFALRVGLGLISTPSVVANGDSLIVSNTVGMDIATTSASSLSLSSSSSVAVAVPAAATQAGPIPVPPVG